MMFSIKPKPSAAMMLRSMMSEGRIVEVFELVALKNLIDSSEKATMRK